MKVKVPTSTPKAQTNTRTLAFRSWMQIGKWNFFYDRIFGLHEQKKVKALTVIIQPPPIETLPKGEHSMHSLTSRSWKRVKVGEDSKWGQTKEVELVHPHMIHGYPKTFNWIYWLHRHLSRKLPANIEKEPKQPIKFSRSVRTIATPFPKRY